MVTGRIFVTCEMSKGQVILGGDGVLNPCVGLGHWSAGI
jgi:hypothetical protein